MAIAYFLDPVADRLEAVGFSRALATGVITLMAVFAFVFLALLVLPALVTQTAGLIEAAPEYAHNMQVVLTERFPDLGDANSTIRRTLVSIGETIGS